MGNFFLIEIDDMGDFGLRAGGGGEFDLVRIRQPLFALLQIERRSSGARTLEQIKLTIFDGSTEF